ncbi:hypothetical protein O4090_17460, partial [Dietzia kunjamensis]|nr:hypothetical protein [Dietzia kunjamensis]
GPHAHRPCQDRSLFSSLLAEMTGLSARDVGAAIRSAKNSEDDNDEASGESESESTGSASEDAETGTAVDSSDSNGASNH